MKKLTILFSLVLILSGCGPGQNEETLAVKGHPALKLGLTTQSFSGCLEISLPEMLKLVDFADEKGFVYMEIRDPEASLTPEECRQLDKYAQSREIELSYAIQKGLLDEGFMDVFARGLENAQQFSGPAVFRAPAAGQELIDHPEKAGWTNEEFSELMGIAMRCGKMCAEKGIQFVVENSLETIDGGPGAYGLTDLFELTGSVVGWQFDTGNFLGLAHTRATVEQVGKFMERFSNRLHYIHLKSVQNGDNMPYLDDSELSHALVFDYLSQHNVPYIAIELQCLNDLEGGYANVERSLAYLRKNGLLE